MNGEHQVEISNPSIDANPQPVLGYATVVAALKNPISVSAVVCAGLPFGLTGAAAWIPDLYWQDLANMTLRMFGLLAMLFGLLGVWLCGDRRYVVMGRVMGSIAAAVGFLEVCAAMALL